MVNGHQEAESRAEGIYYEAKIELEERCRAEEHKMAGYYRDKEMAIGRIAVDNIRQSKLRELERERREQARWARRRRQPVPSLNCEQIAYVEFV